MHFNLRVCLALLGVVGLAGQACKANRTGNSETAGWDQATKVTKGFLHPGTVYYYCVGFPEVKHEMPLSDWNDENKRKLVCQADPNNPIVIEEWMRTLTSNHYTGKKDKDWALEDAQARIFEVCGNPTYFQPGTCKLLASDIAVRDRDIDGLVNYIARYSVKLKDTSTQPFSKR